MMHSQHTASAITPELVLIDPDLRARLIRQLGGSEAPMEASSRQPPFNLGVSATGRPGAPAARGRSRRARKALVRTVIISSFVVNGIVLGNEWNGHARAPALAAAPAAADVPVETTTTTATEGVPVSLEISWHSVAGASYYNLVVWRGHRRILDLLPTSTRVLLPGTWEYRGARGAISPGRYVWFVHPGFGAKGSADYRAPVQHGVIVVNDKKGRI